MKKFALLLGVVLFSVQMFAQNPVSSAAAEYAQSTFNPSKIITAKNSIDNAITMEKYVQDARTWYLRGIIYKRLHEIAHLTDNIKVGMTEDQVSTFVDKPSITRNYRKLSNGIKNSYVYTLVVYFENDTVHSYELADEALLKKGDEGIDALDIAYKSFQKSAGLDPSYRGDGVSKTAVGGIKRIAHSYFNNGIVSLKALDNEDALVYFEKAINCYKVSGSQVDPNLEYYAGLAASYDGKKDKIAIDHFETAEKLGVEEVLLFNRLSEHYKIAGEYEKAIEITQKGRALHPKNQSLLIDETNIYLKIGKPDKAIELLKLAIEADPTNANFHFTVGTNYDELKEDSTLTPTQRDQYVDLASQSYENAIKADANHKDAIYNLGALHFNEGFNWYKNAANLPLGDTLYDVYKAKGALQFKLALPYMEKYHELDANDKNTMKTLVVIYQNLKMVPKMKAMRVKLAAE